MPARLEKRYQLVWQMDGRHVVYSLVAVYLTPDGELRRWSKRPHLPRGGNRIEIEAELEQMVRDALAWRSVHPSDLKPGLRFQLERPFEDPEIPAIALALNVTKRARSVAGTFGRETARAMQSLAHEVVRLRARLPSEVRMRGVEDGCRMTLEVLRKALDHEDAGEGAYRYQPLEDFRRRLLALPKIEKEPKRRRRGGSAKVPGFDMEAAE